MRNRNPRRNAPARRPRPQRYLQDPLTATLSGVGYYSSISGTGAFAATRVAVSSSTFATLVPSMANYSEYRIEYIRFIMVCTAPSSALGTVFLSADYDTSLTDPPLSYATAISRPARIIMPASAPNTCVNQRSAFGKPAPSNTLPFNPKTVSLRWYQTDTTSDVFSFNYGSNGLQSGLSAAEIHIAFRITVRGQRTIT